MKKKLQKCLSDDEEERRPVNLYKARLGIGIPEEERRRLIFVEMQEIETEIKRRSKKSTQKSNWFWWINFLFNFGIIGGSAAVTLLTGISEHQNIPVIVIGSVMFFISGIRELLKLGDRGYYYRQGTYRLRRILQQIRDILYMFQNYSVEQILIMISSLRTEIDEIDMDLYRSSMTGNANFDSGLNIVQQQPPVNKHSDSEQGNQTPPQIHIHIDTPNSSPTTPKKYSSSEKNQQLERVDSLTLLEEGKYSTPIVRIEEN